MAGIENPLQLCSKLLHRNRPTQEAEKERAPEAPAMEGEGPFAEMLLSVDMKDVRYDSREYVCVWCGFEQEILEEAT